MSTLPVTLPPLDQQTRQQLLAQEAQRGGLLPLALPVPQQAAVPVQQPAAAPGLPQPELYQQQKQQMIEAQGQYQQALQQEQQRLEQARQADQQAAQQFQQYVQQASEKPPEMPTTFRKPKWWEMALGMGIGALAGAYGTDTPLGQAGLIAGASMAHRNQVEAFQNWQRQFTNWSLRHKQALDMLQVATRQRELSQRDVEFAFTAVDHIRGELLKTTQALAEMGLNEVTPEFAQSANDIIASMWRLSGMDPKKQPTIRPGQTLSEAQHEIQLAAAAAETGIRYKELQEQARMRAAVQQQNYEMRRSTFFEGLTGKIGQLAKDLMPFKPDEFERLQQFANSTSPEQAFSIDALGVLFDYLRRTGGNRLLRSELERVWGSLGLGTNIDIWWNKVKSNDPNALNVLGRPDVVQRFQRVVRLLVNQQEAVQNALLFAQSAVAERMARGDTMGAAGVLSEVETALRARSTMRVLIGVDQNGQVVPWYYYDLGIDPDKQLRDMTASEMRDRGFTPIRDVRDSEAPTTISAIEQTIQAARRSRPPGHYSVPPRF